MELPTAEILDNINNAAFDSNDVKVYPYRMINSKNTDLIAQNNSYALISIANKKYNRIDPNVNWKLDIDDNGNPYFTITPSVNLIANFDATQGTSSNQHKLYKQVDISGILDSNYKGIDIFKDIDENGYINVFTIGAPFNKKAIENGDQGIYINRNTNTGIENDDDWDSNENDLLNQNNKKTIQFMNMSEIEGQYTNFKFKWVLNKPFKIDNDINTNHLNIGVNGGTLLAHDGVRIKLRDGNSYLQTKINVNKEPLDNNRNTPLLASIAKVNDNVSIYTPWFDNNITLSYSQIASFIDADDLKLESLFKDRDGYTVDGTDKAIETLLDLIEINVVFTSQWAGFEKYTSSDIGTGARQIAAGDVGKVIGTQYFAGNSGGPANVEYNAVSATQAMSKSALVLSNEKFDKWRHINKVQTDSQLFKCMRQAICALSQYINSDFAIAQGANEFNKAFLPWTAKITTPLEMVKIGDIDPRTDNVLYQLKQTPEVIIESQYFWIDGEFAFQPPNVDAASVKTISTDRTITLPTIPTTITEGNISSFPADINTSNGDILKYLWYIIGDPHLAIDTTMRKLFHGEDHYNHKAAKNVQFTTPATIFKGFVPASVLPNGFVPDINNVDEVKKYIVQSYAWKYDLPVTGVTATNVGTINKTKTFQDIPYSYTHNSPTGATEKGWSSLFYTNAFNALPETGDVFKQLDNNVFKQMIQQDNNKHIKWDDNFFDSTEPTWYKKDGTLVSAESTFELSGSQNLDSPVTLDLFVYKWENATLTITKDNPKAILRKSTFSKNEWQTWLDSNIPRFTEDTDIVIGFNGLQSLDYNDLAEISITALWNDKLIIKPFDDGEEIEVKAFNIDDQTQTLTKILFL